MRFMFGILAACILAVSTGADGARAEDARSRADLMGFRQAFAREVPVGVAFESSGVALQESAMKRLDQQAAWLTSHPGLRARVYGIAAKTGYAPRNMALAMKRANAVVRYLVSKGVDPSRLDAVVLFGNAPKPMKSDARAAAVTEILDIPTRVAGSSGSTS